MISVICTGNGTHREQNLRRFTNGARIAQGEYVWWQPYADGWREGGEQRWKRGRLQIEPTRPLADRYEFTCKRCRRNTQLNRAKLVKLLDGLRDTPGAWPLDISYLPF
jgi:hypothetical protein